MGIDSTRPNVLAVCVVAAVLTSCATVPHLSFIHFFEIIECYYQLPAVGLNVRPPRSSPYLPDGKATNLVAGGILGSQLYKISPTNSPLARVLKSYVLKSSTCLVYQCMLSVIIKLTASSFSCSAKIGLLLIVATPNS